MTERPAKLICVKEAVMPGLGHFHPGDEIIEPELIEAIGKNHPFFEVSGIDRREDAPAEPETNKEGN